MTTRASSVAVDRLETAAYAIPTEGGPEADGTLRWDATILVVVHVAGGGCTGMGYTYADTATATLIRDKLGDLVVGSDALALTATRAKLVRAVRNLGRTGIAAMAIAAIDNALWDLKARLLDLPLAVLLGAARGAVRAYGSGGFTSYSEARLSRQLAQWMEAGLTMVKMKVGENPDADVQRVEDARAAIGPQTALFVDANGAYTHKQALAFAERFAEYGVCWFEEPVSSDDLSGLRLLRDRAPAGMDISAGEYGYDSTYFRRMLAAGAVDVLQADATRCGGVSGFLHAAALSHGFEIPLSSHCAPSLHLHPCCAADGIAHAEYFFDHARIEALLFDGAAQPRDGMLQFDPARPGFGLELKRADAARYAV